MLTKFWGISRGPAEQLLEWENGEQVEIAYESSSV